MCAGAPGLLLLCRPGHAAVHNSAAQSLHVIIIIYIPDSILDGCVALSPEQYGRLTIALWRSYGL